MALLAVITIGALAALLITLEAAYQLARLAGLSRLFSWIIKP